MKRTFKIEFPEECIWAYENGVYIIRFLLPSNNTKKEVSIEMREIFDTNQEEKE